MFTYDGSVLQPWQGSLKINDESPVSSWCADSSDPDKIQFLQLDFKLVKVIHAIAIQSHSSEEKYVKTFTISSSLDGIFWNQYIEVGDLKVQTKPTADTPWQQIFSGQSLSENLSSVVLQGNYLNN